MVPYRAGNSDTRKAWSTKRWEMKLPSPAGEKMQPGSASEPESLRRETHEVGAGAASRLPPEGEWWKVSGGSSQSQKYAFEMLGSLLVYAWGRPSSREGRG